MQVMQNFIKYGQIRVLFSDDGNFRDYKASVMHECMDMQHWSDTDRGERMYIGAIPVPFPHCQPQNSHGEAFFWRYSSSAS
jgi:hypothetical protein